MAHAIPSEIITDILYRLPAKSIGRFRCVSKSWLSQLTDPQFIKTYQNTLNREHLIFNSRKYRFLYSLPFHQNHEEESILSLPKNLRCYLFSDDIFAEGCCNGLVLAIYFYPRRRLIILNPTTGEFVELPTLGEFAECCCNANKHHQSTFGFGYDSVTDDYKVVAFPLAYIHHADHVFGDVYSLRNNSWKSVSYDPLNSSWLRGRGAGWGWGLSGVFVNGCLHWLATNGRDMLPVIVTFSLKDDNFSQMMLPNMGINVDVIEDCHLANLGGKFAVYVESEGAVWMMNEYGVKESWTKILLHRFNYIPPDIKVTDVTVVDFHGKILLVKDRHMCLYNLEDGSLCKHINPNIYQHLMVLSVRGICAESLVPLPKVQLDESPDSSQGRGSSVKGKFISAFQGESQHMWMLKEEHMHMSRCQENLELESPKRLSWKETLMKFLKLN